MMIDFEMLKLSINNDKWGEPHPCPSMPMPILAKFGGMGMNGQKILENFSIVAIFMHVNIVIHEN